jgi:hypothetical protein
MNLLSYIEPNATDTGSTLWNIALWLGIGFAIGMVADVLHQAFTKKDKDQ